MSNIYKTISILKDAIKDTIYEDRMYIAGGFVRDNILGLSPKDIDIIVDGDFNSSLVAAEFLAKKLNIYREGSNPVVFPKYYTAKLYITETDTEVEFVSPRKELYENNNRKPIVSEATLYEDVIRRDFTINSLLVNLSTGEILDLTNRGRKDLEEGILNTCGDSDIIFSEDPLRILRGIRFAVKYNFKLPFSVIKAIKRNAVKLHNISIERINDELSKILILDNPSKAIELMRITGILQLILPEIYDLVGLEQNGFHMYDAYYHTLSVVDKTEPILINRLAALLHDIGKKDTKTTGENGKIHFYEHEKISEYKSKELLIRLKYSNDVIKAVCAIVKYHMSMKCSTNPDNIKDSTIRKFIYNVKYHYMNAIDVMHADSNSVKEEFRAPKFKENLTSRVKEMDISSIINTVSILDGYELMALGASGPLLGSIQYRIVKNMLKNTEYNKHDAIGTAKALIKNFKEKE